MSKVPDWVPEADRQEFEEWYENWEMKDAHLSDVVWKLWNMAWKRGFRKGYWSYLD